VQALVGTGPPRLLEFREVPDPPPPRPDEVTVAVRYFSVNRGELHRLREKPPGWRPGWDFAGQVLAASGASGLQAGQWVCGVVPGGAWAQVLNAPVSHLAPIPPGADPVDAACVPVAGLTAMRALALAGPLADRTVMVVGAAGGVGQFALQFAHDAGAAVVGLTSSLARFDSIRRCGARPLLRSQLDGLVDEVDVVLESAGGSTLAAAVHALAARGTIVLFGNSERADTVLPTSRFYAKEATLVGYHLLQDLRRQPPALDLPNLLDRLAGGRLNVARAGPVPWSRIDQVLDNLARRRIDGKAVVEVTPGPGVPGRRGRMA
jgi:NADPH:quinone reductase-like Zn-dependent oxidoreductase